MPDSSTPSLTDRVLSFHRRSGRPRRLVRRAGFSATLFGLSLLAMVQACGDDDASVGTTTSASSVASTGGSGGNGGSGAAGGGGTGGSVGSVGSGGAGGDTGTGGSAGTGGSGGGMSATWTMGAPFSKDAPVFASATHPLAPTALWGAQMSPRPTNAFWMDAVLDNGTNSINVLPYVVRTLPQGLQFSLPSKVVDTKFILSVFNHDLSFGATEAIISRAVTAHDLLSFTAEWNAGAGTMTAPVVRGMPFATMVYDALTPKLETAHTILSVNGSQTSPVSGDAFSLALNNGQTWKLYASAPLTLTWGGGGGSLDASQPFTGVLRAANVPNSPGALAALDAHKDRYPTGGDVLVSVEGDDATIAFNWKAEGSGPLLMSAMPHHQDTLVAPTTVGPTHATLRGDLQGVSGDSWTLKEPLQKTTWSAPTPVAADKLAAVKASLASDAADPGIVPVAADPYFFGKQVAKLGRLALIADELGESAIAMTIREKMKTALNPWLSGTNANPLKYESTWGGVVSTAGLGSAGADFGLGWYNDHHFHFGYFLYAAAALGKGDAAWLAANKAAVTALARDIANPSPDDPYFPAFRNKDWYEGHSWAAGLFPFGDGRNQESTSEAVNAWYGLRLFGLIAGDPDLENVGRVLLATEIRTTQRYWQIKSNDAIYDEPFASNKVVGVLWGTKVDYATFFGANVEFIHAIQMIPFTPISEALLPFDWVSEEYPVLAPAMATASEGWKGFIVMDHAILDPGAAWTEANALTSFDDGNSKTNTLYWIATRPTP